MKLPVPRILVALIISVFVHSAGAQSTYFFGSSTDLNPAIPSPEEFLGYPIGEFHTRHDMIVGYLKELASKSDKANFQVIGYTNEHRPQVVLTVTDPGNYANLEQIRQDHLDIAVGAKVVSDEPVINLLGYNVHGNEPSSSEAAMLTAYYMVASTKPETLDYLKNAVTFIDPSYNPDGRDRHTNWANMHKGNPKVSDPLDREHNEVWPRGRTNHYWFDLNRDWLPLAQIESRNRLKFYHQWLPNVVTDYHEMGTNSTYFFEPTEPFGSENPVVPRDNYDKLNNIFAKYYVEAMDGIGSLYFTKEQYDNSYPGYGSTYPDIHGGLGMVFEQASSRGHLQRSSTGELTFAFTIRNHVTTSLATVKAAVENRAVLLNHQKQFFSGAMSEGQKSGIKGYVYGDENDGGRTRAFTDLLLKHNIEVYKSSQPVTSANQRFEANNSFVVPTNQVQYRMVRTIFEKVTNFYDSVFYDASAWTVALAYNMPHAELRGALKLGQKVEEVVAPSSTVEMASYAYLIPWSDYYAPRLLQYLLTNEVNVKTAFRGFTAATNSGSVDFGYGSLMVPVVDQKIMPDQLFRLIQQASIISGVKVYSMGTGYSNSGIDLGSGNFRTVSKPKPLMLIGGSSSSYEAGEIWHLLDTKVGMPITKVDQAQFGRVNLNDYNTLVLVSGNYNSLGEGRIADIKKWVQDGGTLITIRSATQWAIRSKLVDQELVGDDEKNEMPRTNFDLAREYSGSKRIGGSIYQTDVDPTHPLGFGYTSRDLAVYKNSNVILKPSKSPYSTVVKYNSNPLLGGYVHSDNLTRIKNSASLVVDGLGRGRVILFADNPNFRGFWYGTNRLFLNALFFGNLVTDPN